MGFGFRGLNLERGDLWENPMGTNGFEFVEFSGPEPQALAALFERMGFRAVGRHRSKDVTLYRQGDINFILNAQPESFAERFADTHGPCINAIAFRVDDATAALKRAQSLGAKIHQGQVGPMELNIPAIDGIGGSLLYLVDRFGSDTIYDVDFKPVPGVDPNPEGAGLLSIDHLTHNVARGNMERWADFYGRLFGFREIRYFDIEGKLTGLKSKAMTSPCGKIRIPINESSDDKSQIEEYLNTYRGEGVQHVALSARDVIEAVRTMTASGVKFLDTPDTYYEMIDTRLPGHGLDIEPLRRHRVLVDGAPSQGAGILLQIFTENVIGPIFFELIERRGNDGFGEGNFKALFESMELDQIRRGVLQEG